MIKITNTQASALMSKIIADLFTDQGRKFPVADAFRLSDAIQLVQARVPAYRTQLKAIVESCKGNIADDGHIFYENEQGAQEAQNKIDELNAIEIEIGCDPIKIGAEWPKLSIAEATILRPLLDGFET